MKGSLVRSDGAVCSGPAWLRNQLVATEERSPSLQVAAADQLLLDVVKQDAPLVLVGRDAEELLAWSTREQLDARLSAHVAGLRVPAGAASSARVACLVVHVPRPSSRTSRNLLRSAMRP